MAYLLKPSASHPGRHELDLRGAPDYVRGLIMAPTHLEPELASGRWLVLAFAVWSLPDRLCVDKAIGAAKAWAGRVLVGLRPYDDPKEFAIWCPAVPNLPTTEVLLQVATGPLGSQLSIRGDSFKSPLWLALEDGKVKLSRSGPLALEEVTELLREAFPDG